MADKIIVLPQDIPILNRALLDIEQLRRQVQQQQQLINALRAKAGI